MTLPAPDLPTVHILLATYQGGGHLHAQLESIAEQTHARWTLLISDDGSSDETPAIARRFAADCTQKVTLIQGPCKGSTFNFFHLINSIDYPDRSDLFAFCDQDDVWLPDKLAAAVASHTAHSAPNAPNLYCGRTQITNASLVPLGESAIPRKALTLGNALTQNIASGNTMVFTARLLEILRRIKPEHSVLHDWSAYQVATACGGVIHYDAQMHLQYRQHSTNVVGANDGTIQRLERLLANLRGRYRAQGNQTERAMQDIAPWMTNEAQRIFKAYQATRHARSGIQRLRHAYAAGLSRQTRLDQIALQLAVLTGLV